MKVILLLANIIVSFFITQLFFWFCSFLRVVYYDEIFTVKNTVISPNLLVWNLASWKPTPKYDSRTFQVQFTCKKCKRNCFNVCCRIEKVDRILWIRKDRLFCGINHKITQQRLLSESSTLTLEKSFGQSKIIRIGNYSKSCYSKWVNE